MAIYLGKVSDHRSFQYSFLSRRNLDGLKAKMIAHYRAMIEAIEKDTRDFDRYLRYESKLRKMIISGRYTYQRLEHLMSKVRSMRWYIEEEFGRSDDHCVSILPSPEGYAQKLWENARDRALAEQWRARREAQRREMRAAIDRGEASYDDFCHVCCHRWSDDDHDARAGVWLCPECGEKMWDDNEVVFW